MNGGRSRRAVAIGVVLLVAAIIVAVQFRRLDRQPPPEAAGPDDPPAGVQLLYVVDQSRPHWAVAYDWSGKRRGSLHFPFWFDVSHLRPAPDGSAFMVDPPTQGDYAAYFDRLGHLVLETSEPAFISQVWADDNKHVCLVVDTDNGPAIVTRLPGSSDRTALLGLPETLAHAQVVPGTCDLRADAAELGVRADTGDWHVVRMRLSNGTLVNDRNLGPLTAAAVSRDGAYLAAGGAVYRSADMTTPLARIDAAVTPLAFSGDDSLLLEAAAEGTTMEVIEWRTGRVVWQEDTGGTYGPWLARPSGGDFAVALGTLSTIVIVHPDGTTTTLGTRQAVAW